MKLNENFNQQEFIDWISNFLPDFSKDIRKVDVSKSFQGIKSIQTIGESSIGLRVYIIETEQDPSRRKVSLAKESFTLLRDYGTPNAIIAYHCTDSVFWRLSLLTSTLSWDEGKINKKLSNPKRQSYILGSKAKVKTPHQYLVTKGAVIDLKDLKNRFSLEVVNKEFYKEISRSFIDLVGGTLTKGKSKEVIKSQLKLPFVVDHSQTAQEFVVRLIGRVIFSWFLREKKSSAGHSLMPHDLLSLASAKSIGDYYHTILEPIFFEVLNKKINTRKEIYAVKPFSDIPYLNGGLFAPHDDDHYSYNDGKQAINHNLVVIPDSWFVSFFEILETYNFTIDENTSFDEELSIDPEMLGRIFENLLAEINPETGESARKSTGSYYTPRVIVDYMVDESLYLYLKNKTNITENKLRSVISYDLEDDSTDPLTDLEKDKITQSLQSIKILDPACGSGAFPMGALQKIVFILQQIDPHGQLWFNKQIHNTSVELRRLIQMEFEEKNFDYLRKIGIIRENIYGVDIQPIATEISRLRCFLTLVVDQRIDDTHENRGIEPLPNLDFKFVTANTLLGMPQQKLISGAVQQDLFDSNQSAKIEALRHIRDEYFNCADAVEKSELKSEFRRIQNDLWSSMHQMNAFGQQSLALSGWDPFSHKPTDWFDPEWMFGVKDGFDIVIANPPYIGEKGHKDIFRSIRQGTLKPFYERKMDIFYFFFHLGLSISTENGIVAFITTNYYLTASGAKKLRTRFATDTTIVRLCNFNEYKIFESAKGQHNILTILQKGKLNVIANNFITQNMGVATPEDLTNLLAGFDEKTHYFKINQNELYDGPEFYIRINGKSLNPGDSSARILEKISNGTPLWKMANINMGVQSGADEVGKKLLEKAISSGFVDKSYLIRNNIEVGSPIYVVNKEFASELNQTERNALRPFIKNSDIKRYFIPTNFNKFYLYVDSAVNIEKLPTIKQHLLKFRPILKAREQVNDQEKSWFWIRGSKRKYLVDLGENIVCPYRAKDNIFSLTNGTVIGAGDVYFITKKRNDISLRYVLALLNSKLYYFWLYNRGKRKGETLELYQKPLSEIPIKEIPESEQQSFISLVDQILSITNKQDYDIKNPPKEQKELEKQIDSLVYKLYELSEEEIDVVERS